MSTNFGDRMTQLSTDSVVTPGKLPVVVQLGFAGSRQLFAEDGLSKEQEDAFLATIEAHLTERLRRLPVDLHLGKRHFLCGISQVAIGGDTLFTRACRALEIPQRILLPQPLDEYLTATGSEGERDFSDDEQRTARELLTSPHVIHERVVSDAPDRHSRFEDVNLEIVRVSDVLVCLRRADVAGKTGGTSHLLELAVRYRRHILDIQVSIQDGKPKFAETWHYEGDFTPPQLPPEIDAATLRLPSRPGSALPSVADFCGMLRKFTSSKSIEHRQLFKRAALVIIGAHVAATMLAVAVLLIHGAGLVPWLLSGEMALLAGGFLMHFRLHHSRASRVWALSRLVSEVSRSVRAAGEVHLYLSYLFWLPFPPGIRPLLRTMNVLHLRSTRPKQEEPWQPKRDRYVWGRFRDPVNGQLVFYSRSLAKARRGLLCARTTFYACSFSAMSATLLKLFVLCHCLPMTYGREDAWANLFGALAIVMPVLAVAALSLAASFDLEALVQTYGETLQFLEKQEGYLSGATSEREFSKLLIGTEGVLLGETATWASRRSFKEVT